ncbi:hypothetical protein A2363_01640 [Candidatus Gottesmanbacteria bacterium RIFOXYB1_FULL_47_11]|uniref:Glycosyltransferase RgtA/B/C/D-like domain-containing protein n=1 Tax=Candidatus Gottesmanbacteria bacterium RIFOXYB1_FULL_47_11 TaxID=1798401 RepID=A0A1F6BGI0_9BACT|nr:MAG: hypothetical protein A2363_01640 [Candidatus Gottesmanbacteria bacterium RIFOXYB1_FULL_47_11]
MKHNPLLTIFLLALLVRVLYGIGAPLIVYGPDSTGYYEIGRDIIVRPSTKTLLHPYRTPLYPLFLQGVFYAVGAGGAAEGTAAFDYGIQTVVIIQIILGAAAFAVFALSLKHWIGSPWYPAAAAFLLLDVFTFAWERSILTEGIGISILLLTTAVLLSIIRLSTKRKFIGLFVLFTLGFFLRPALLTIPLSSLPILAWYFRKNYVFLVACLLSLAAFIVIPALYTYANRVQYGFTGLQIVGDIDMLGRILETNIPIESGSQYSYFYNNIKDYQSKQLNPHPFRFLEYYDPGIYANMERFNELHAFNQAVMVHNIPLLGAYTIQNIPDVLLAVNEFTLVQPNLGRPLTTIVWLLQKFYGSIQFLTLLVPVLWIISVVLFVKHPTRTNTVLTLIGAIAVGQILLVAGLVYHDIGDQYGRVIAIARPHMALFLLLAAYQWYTRNRP